MKHEKLFDMRCKNIITIPEYMVIYNWYFGNWNEFLRFSKLSKKRCRELYCSGVNKIKKYIKNEIQQ